MTANFGSVSSGTMRPEDLIPAFAAELEWLTSNGRADRTTRESELISEADGMDLGEGFDQGQADDLLSDLFDALNDHAPFYGYFGAHFGDGVDYGFWLSEGFEDDFDGLKVSDTSEIPDGYVGEVLHVNDHGNVTLYAKDDGSSELREIWSLV